MLQTSTAGAEMYALVGEDGSVTITDTRSDVRMRPYAPGDLERWAMRQPGVPHRARRLSRPHQEGRFDALIAAAASKYGVPFALVKAVVAAESGFEPKALSRAGAQGLMQLMPETARELGVTDGFNPAQNIDGGTRYLARLRQLFGNDRLAIAAYNAGPGRVRRAGRVPNIAETRAYVRKVLRLARAYGGDR